MCEIIDNGKTRIVNNGVDVTIITRSSNVDLGIQASKVLGVRGISTAVIEMITLDPFDRDTIQHYGEKTKGLVFLDAEVYDQFLEIFKELKLNITTKLTSDPTMDGIVKTIKAMIK